LQRFAAPFVRDFEMMSSAPLPPPAFFLRAAMTSFPPSLENRIDPENRETARL
jgi:hypothetical protein